MKVIKTNQYRPSIQSTKPDQLKGSENPRGSALESEEKNKKRRFDLYLQQVVINQKEEVENRKGKGYIIFEIINHLIPREKQLVRTKAIFSKEKVGKEVK